MYLRMKMISPDSLYLVDWLGGERKELEAFYS